MVISAWVWLYYLPITQGRHFFIASNGRLGDRWHLRRCHGRNPSRFVLNIECCLRARKHRGEALNSMSMLPRNLTWCVASLTAHVLHVKLLRENRCCELTSQGSPDSFTPRTPLSRYSGNSKTSKSLKSSHHSVPVRQLKLHDSRRLRFALRKKLRSSHLKIFVTPGDFKFKMSASLAENTTNLLRRCCQTVTETLSP